MKRLILAFAIAALVVPATALGKGPSAASIDGPGIDGGISVSGIGIRCTPLCELTSRSGLYLQTFGEDPGKTLISRPNRDLGPKYTITWTVPGPSNELWKLRQDVYPYATPTPVTYMEPGQDVYTQQTRGGWFQADARLKDTLVAAGLPAQASGVSSDDSLFSAGLIGLFATALLLASATAVIMRRRARPAAA
jgi:hypothetical protein